MVAEIMCGASAARPPLTMVKYWVKLASESGVSSSKPGTLELAIIPPCFILLPISIKILYDKLRLLSLTSFVERMISCNTDGMKYNSEGPKSSTKIWMAESLDALADM